MANFCKNCDGMNDIPSSNASIRPAFRQPTMYDHIDIFSKHKQAKDLTRKLCSTKEQLLKLNPKFTNFQLDTKNDGLFEAFSTRDIAKFRSDLKEGRFHNKPENEEPEGLCEKQKKSVSLVRIPSTPVYCPVSKCSQTISAMSVLSHFLSDHNNELVVECRNLYTEGRSILLFNRDVFAFGENVCLGILPYGGIEGKQESLPAVRGICKGNSFLPKSYAHLKNHLPIFVMVCKTSICTMLEMKALSEELMDPQNEAKQILIIWLVTAQTIKPIFCTITAFDKSMMSSRSTIVQVRSLVSPQNPKDFLSRDTNYLMLNHGEMDILTEQATKPIHIEIKIHEFDE